MDGPSFRCYLVKRQVDIISLSQLSSFFVRGDFVKEMIMDEPYLARLTDPCIESEESDSGRAIDHCIVRLLRGSCFAPSRAALFYRRT
jgi:hypothetical protein